MVTFMSISWNFFFSSDPTYNMALMLPSDASWDVSNRQEERLNSSLSFETRFFWFDWRLGPFLSVALVFVTLPPTMAQSLLQVDAEVTSSNSRRVLQTLRGSFLLICWLWAFFLILLASKTIWCAETISLGGIMSLARQSDSLVLNFCLASLVSYTNLISHWSNGQMALRSRPCSWNGWMLKGHFMFLSASQTFSATLIFCPICISSLYSTSTSKLEHVIHQARPPTILSKALSDPILILKYPASSRISQISRSLGLDSASVTM